MSSPSAGRPDVATDNGGERAPLAPVIPLFGGAGSLEPDPTPGRDHDDGHRARDARDTRDEGRPPSPDEMRERAERTLTRKLSARSLSVREARAAITDRDLSAGAVDDIIAAFVHRGYLGDAALADQLVRAGTDRKGQGRRALSQTMAKRGIPRDVADAAIGQLPDDDAERALAFARTKAAALQRVPADAALRRLVGQLSRRGYGGSVAMTAAREALAEAAAGY